MEFKGCEGCCCVVCCCCCCCVVGSCSCDCSVDDTVGYCLMILPWDRCGNSYIRLRIIGFIAGIIVVPISMVVVIAIIVGCCHCVICVCIIIFIYLFIVLYRCFFTARFSRFFLIPPRKVRVFPPPKYFQIRICFGFGVLI